MTSPVSGGVLYSLSRCIVFVRASWTWFLVVSDLMFPAVPHSSLRFAMTSCTGFLGGTYRETSSVPLPSLLLSSEMGFLTLYSLTESVFVDNAELPVRQDEETAGLEAADNEQSENSLTHL